MHAEVADLGEDDLEQCPLAEPICTHQCVDRIPRCANRRAYSKSRGRRFDAFDRNLVGECPEDRLDVSLDARTEQREQLRIVTQLVDFVGQGPLDGTRHFGQSLTESAHDRRSGIADLGILVAITHQHGSTVVRPTPLCSRHRNPPQVHRGETV